MDWYRVRSIGDFRRSIVTLDWASCHGIGEVSEQLTAAALENGKNDPGFRCAPSGLQGAPSAAKPAGKASREIQGLIVRDERQAGSRRLVVLLTKRVSLLILSVWPEKK